MFGRHDETAHRRHQVAADLAARSRAPADHLGGGDEGVVADAHRGRPGMVLDAVDRQARPGDGDDALDDADGEALLLEERALLDVELEVGAHGRGMQGSGPR